MNNTKRTLAVCLLTGAVLGLSGMPHAVADTPGGSILSGIALIGSNANANSDDSNSQNVVANGNQFASGIGVTNSPSMVVGDTINDFQSLAGR
ncbi:MULTISPECIES: hypothetical protein [unclassified Streptomyces]|uniref:hypothetical protein n=1 Tax=unclassified Streptomyces TaxID=2593676 RepID=UPI000B24A97B|nr:MULTISPECIES: hypothetical protein [unclassified Streptomyces]